MSNLIEEQDVKSQMFPFGAFKFTDPAADATPTLSLKAPWTWSANLAFTTVTDANGTVATTDPYMQYYYSTGNSDRTCTLPAATGAGQIVAVYKTDAGTGDIDVTPAGTDKINGYNAVWKINGRYQYVVLQDRAAGEWHVLDCLGTLLEFTSTADVQPGVVCDTWYNPTGHSLVVTPGTWKPRGQVTISIYESVTAVVWAQIQAHLGYTTSTPIDLSYQVRDHRYQSTAMGINFESPLKLEGNPITLAVNTTIYLNIYGNTAAGGNMDWLKTIGSVSASTISARRIA